MVQSISLVYFQAGMTHFSEELAIQGRSLHNSTARLFKRLCKILARIYGTLMHRVERTGNYFRMMSGEF